MCKFVCLCVRICMCVCVCADVHMYVHDSVDTTARFFFLAVSFLCSLNVALTNSSFQFFFFDRERGWRFRSAQKKNTHILEKQTD